MVPHIGTAEDLVRRTENSGKLILLRAINDYELTELVENGPDHFSFHKGTLYEKVLGNMIAKHGRLRSGTVIVYVPSEADINSEPRNFELNDSFVTCKKDFSGPIEAFNIRGFNWEGILEYLRKYGPGAS